MKSKYIKLIHIAKKQLNLDDDTYRHLLTSETKKTSTKDMTVWELEKVIKNLKDKGFKVRSNSKKEKITATEPMHKKIRSLWLTLAEKGAVKNSSERALNAYIKRITGVELMNWLSDPESIKVIETLKKWLSRVEVKHERKA